MYVCVCNAVTENQVREALEEVGGSVAYLRTKLGVGACCGSCVEVAEELINEKQVEFPIPIR